jgi:uncharacterized membrane protein
MTRSETASATRRPKATGVSSSWVPVTGLVLSLIGLGVSIYLTIVHYVTPQALACPDKGVINCAKVITSPESVVFGIPVAVYGLPFFVVMVAANLPAAWRSRATWLVWGRLIACGVGVVSILYLLYVELFEVDNLCLWCTGVHLITLILFGVTLAGTSRLIGD